MRRFPPRLHEEVLPAAAANARDLLVVTHLHQASVPKPLGANDEQPTAASFSNATHTIRSWTLQRQATPGHDETAGRKHERSVSTTPRRSTSRPGSLAEPAAPENPTGLQLGTLLSLRELRAVAQQKPKTPASQARAPPYRSGSWDILGKVLDSTDLKIEPWSIESGATLFINGTYRPLPQHLIRRGQGGRAGKSRTVDVDHQIRTWPHLQPLH